MTQIIIPSLDQIRVAITYNEADRVGRNYVNQQVPVKVYFMPEGSTTDGIAVPYKPYTDAQLAADPSLASLNASFVAITGATARANIMTNVFGVWSKIANITFVETTNPAEAQLRVGAGKWLGGNASVNIPGGSALGQINSVFIRADFYLSGGSPSEFLVNSPATNDLIHEIGHAIGLNHSTIDQSGGVLSADFNRPWFSTLTNQYALGGWGPATPSLFDAVGLQALYGLKSLNETDNYVIAPNTGRLIIDNGGTNTIDASQTSTTNEIDLRATNFSSGKAYFSSIGLTPGPSTRYNAAIFEGTQIENAKGGSGSDRITGNDLNNTLEGGIGNDTFIASKGNDTLKGGANDDTYRFKAGDGPATIVDNEGSNHLYFNDKLVRTFGFKNAASGQYTLPDSNVIQFNSPGVLTLAGGLQITFEEQLTPDMLEENFGFHLFEEGTTPSSYDRTIVGDLAPVDQDPSSSGVQVVKDELDNVIVNAGQVEANRVDTLYDSAGTDDIRAMGGDDFIWAFRGGADRIDGGSGNDAVLGGAGDDIIVGGAGSDLLHGEGGRNRIYGGAQVSIEDALAAQDGTATGLKGEFISGGSDEDIIVGDSGNDLIVGGGADDIIMGGAGDDDIMPDVFVTGVGWDWSVTRSVTTGANGGTVYGTTLNNVGSSGPASLSGDDVVFAGGGVDWVSTGMGNDYVDAGSGDDVVFAHHGGDEVYGGSGNDVLIGDTGSGPYGRRPALRAMASIH